MVQEDLVTLQRTATILTRFRGDSLRNRFVMGAFWSLAGAAVSRGVTMAAAVVVGRALGATGFGELGMIQSTQGLFGVFAGAGLGLAATKHVAEYRTRDWPKAGRCMVLCTRIAVVSGLAAAVVLFVLSGWLASSVLHAPHLVVELRVATGLVLLGAINGVQTGAIAGLENFRTIAGISVIRAGFLFAATVAGVLLAGLMGAVVGLVSAEAVAVVSNHLALRRLHPRPSSRREGAGDLNWREFTGVWRFSLLALLSSLSTMPALWFTNLVLVSQANGYAALGVFNAAERWRQVLLFLPASLSPIILSLLSNLHGTDDTGSYRRVVGMNLWLTAATVLLPAAALALLCRPAMALFGADYEGGWSTLSILAASAVAVVLNNLLGQVLISKAAIWCRFLLDVLLAALLALVSWWLIPVWRENGLALGHLVAYSAAALALLIPARYYLRRPVVARATVSDDGRGS